MEKLKQLLNEWSKTEIENECNWTDVYDGEGVYFLNLFDRDMTMEIEDVISKRNGFIKWLVENEKIDVKELEKSDRPFDVGYATEETLYERVLMLLSIQDEPIEFLVSILK